MEVGDGRPFTPTPPRRGDAYPRDGAMVLLPHWPADSRHPAAPRVLDAASKAAPPPRPSDSTLIPTRPLVVTPWAAGGMPVRAAAPVWTDAGELLRAPGARRRRGGTARAAGAGGPTEVGALAAAFVDARSAREDADGAAADGRAEIAARVGQGVAAALPAITDAESRRVRDGLEALRVDAAAAHARAVAAAKADASAAVAAARAAAEADAAASRAAAMDRVAARHAAVQAAARRAAADVAAATADAAAAVASAHAERHGAVADRLAAAAAEAASAASAELGGRLAAWTAPRARRVGDLSAAVDAVATAARCASSAAAAPAAEAAMARAATALAAAVATAGPVPALDGGAAAGSLAAAVAATLPPSAADGAPLPSAASLRTRWAEGVAWPARVAVLLPAVGAALPSAAAGGVWAHAAATVLAAVKPDFVDVGVAADERALRLASTAVREGDLGAAVAAADGLSGLAGEVSLSGLD